MDFDIEAYKRRTERLRWDDLDIESFRTDRLPEPALRCLRYMHDVEFHTACYLRDLLVSPAHSDPEITAFLSFWIFEEYWHGEALAAVLAAHDEASGAPRVAAMRHRLGLVDKLRPVAMTAASWWAGEDFVAVHMSWGAINEWTTQAGYARLLQRAGNPVLSQLLQRIMRQEGRHIDFYASQASRRLAASARARRLTRMALKQFWAPVGSGVMPETETAHLAGYLFGDPDGEEAMRRIDRRIDRLPGLEGLSLLEGAVTERRSRSTGLRSQLSNFGFGAVLPSRNSANPPLSVST
ncbi:MAG TPA: ferritin-like domain-containing protein [Acidimicrobiales bacterium]|nr:ferritin-like domain-containing protein [Acidimicrobiales bacterium]